MNPRVMVVAGEVSGDRHAAGLLRAAREREPGLTAFGVGGSALRDAGVDVVHEASKISVVGISEVFKRLPVIWGVMSDLKRRLREDRPDVLLLVDFPDFNLHLAKHAKRAGVPVVYFISPQVWAWRRSRIKKIRRLVSLMLVLFPFEHAFYVENGVPVEMVGHPLVDTISNAVARDQACRQLGLPQDGPIYGLLPGSRREEMSRHLEPMLDTARLVARERPNARFVLPLAGPLDPQSVLPLVESSGLPILVRSGQFETMVGAMDAALAASGTVTLELGVFGVPTVVVYRMSAMTHAVGRALVDIPFISLVNLIVERELYPELIQDAFRPDEAARRLLDVAPGGARHDEVQAGLVELREKLGDGGACERAGEALVRFIRGLNGHAAR